jgi:hypothetical protein
VNFHFVVQVNQLFPPMELFFKRADPFQCALSTFVVVPKIGLGSGLLGVVDPVS